MARKTQKKKVASNTKKHMSKKKVVGIGVGVTAAMLAAAGGYFLYGSKNAAKNRKNVRSWMLKAKADVLEGIENAKDLTKDEYEDLVEGAAKVYGKLKTVSKREVGDFKREMKSHWNHLEKRGKKGGAKKKVSQRKVAKKTSVRAGRKRALKKVAKRAGAKKKKK